jgi:membrane protease subunit (stomatin/prohibitin family)
MKDQELKELAKLAASPCEMFDDGACLECNDCTVCGIALEAAEAIRAAGYRKEREARWKGAGMGDYYCSLCQHTISGRTKFCPECGAKMDEWED